MYFIVQDSGDNRLPSINSTNSDFFLFFLKSDPTRTGKEKTTYCTLFVRKTELELEYAPCLYTNYCRKCSSTVLVTLTYIIRVISAEVPPFPGLPSTNQITTTVIMVES